ncbi:MAG: hypothetical protein F6K58_18685 [Symploca sp. SIO2E9]|nr:hypothetical protein [Symploca sp. SIO2E9]
MLPVNKHFCFCTFAASKVYRSLARELAKDLEKYSPGTTFIIFTDNPSEFSNYSNVLVFKHKRQGVLYYHERRFAIAKALSMFNSCIYLDADVRICAPVPEDMQWLPGITARSCTTMVKHLQGLIKKTDPPRPNVIKLFEFIKKMGRKLDLDAESDQVTFINEFLFVVTRDAGKEVEFLKQWEKLALYAEVNGYHKHPGYAMGLAAAKVGFPVRHNVMEGIDFFDDRIERVRIAKGLSDPKAKQVYFETQRRIENPQLSIPEKVMMKASKFIEYYYHLIRLIITTTLKTRGHGDTGIRG